MCQAHGRCHTRISHMMTLPERGGVFHCRINAQMLSECPGGPPFLWEAQRSCDSSVPQSGVIEALVRNRRWWLSMWSWGPNICILGCYRMGFCIQQPLSRLLQEGILYPHPLSRVWQEGILYPASLLRDVTGKDSVSSIPSQGYCRKEGFSLPCVKSELMRCTWLVVVCHIQIHYWLHRLYGLVWEPNHLWFCVLRNYILT